jgi:HAD superfamily hydrolase (TIGR01458 family)
MQALLIDLDGVLYQGDAVIPGAAQTIDWLHRQQIPFVFITNTTSRPRSALVDKLRGFSIEVDAQRIVTPPVAASRWLSAHAPGAVALFVPDATRADFSAVLVVDDAAVSASAVVVGDIGEQWSFARLNRAFRLLVEDPPAQLVALGLTRYWRAADGLRLDVGPFVKALEYASGQTATVLGKPAPAFFAAALDVLGCAAGDAVMIGDDIVGDVQGAQRAGIRGVLVRTGKYRPQDVDGDIRPDAVLDSIADLPAWWAAG